jgi:hypothetical protein
VTCALAVGTRESVVPAQRAATATRPAQRVDVDFDGTLDEVRPRGPCAGNCFFDVWLHRGGTRVYARAWSALPSPVLDPSTRTIGSLESQGLGGAQFRATRFAVRGGRLDAIWSATQRAEPPAAATFRRSVYEHRAGRAVLVCSAVVAPSSAGERIVRIDTGTPTTCDVRLAGERLEAR